MPRFVILEHDHPHLHWDLMLESGAVLRTWRLDAPPSAGRVVGAADSFDHRHHYLDYEGPVSGGRGTVRRWDAGSYEMLSETEGRLEFRAEGERLRGVCRLERTGEGLSRLTVGAAGA